MQILEEISGNSPAEMSERKSLRYLLKDLPGRATLERRQVEDKCMTDWEKQTQELLALAWSLFNEPLWRARRDMELHLQERFELKKTGE